MMHKMIQKPLNNLALKVIYSMVFLCTIGCSKNTSDDDGKRIDQLFNVQEPEARQKTYFKKIDSIRTDIGANDIPRLKRFYAIKTWQYQYHFINYNSALTYADSALALFNDKKIINSHKNLYFDALLLKGDVLFAASKFNQATLSYLEARSFREKNLDSCENNYLAGRIGNVYFILGKFFKAASFYKESYNLENNCKNERDPTLKFYNMQAQLNNAGFCYERLNLLDSATYFYLKDLAFIEESKKNKKISAHVFTDAAAVVYDNLGSIYLKKGNLTKAEEFLTKSINTPYYETNNSVKIPPLIKLATLYTLKKDYSIAQKMFDKSAQLLKVKPSAELESRWFKAKSQFYFQQDKYAQAHQQQQRFDVLKDSIAKENRKLSSINVEKDFANLEQRYKLQELKKRDSIKSIYLLFASFFLIMILVIAFLLLRIIKQSKKNLLISQHHNQQLQETLSKLEDANQNYARVMRVMAHDLKNPLSGITGISSNLLEEIPRQKEKESIEIIKTSADNALGMINEILNSSHVETEKTYLEREKIDIQLVLKQCVSLLNFKAREKEQNLTITFNKPLIVHANKEKLWQVFNNIIVNAIKFSEEKTEIKISIEDATHDVIISIAGRGNGIPPEIAPKIYDIFTEGKHLGIIGEKAHGLGLSISKQIVEAHNGKIWFEDNPEGGTIFYIKLPK
ncbi:sensor histidine kinase [Pedobacter polaris]|uniref:histidine kinase n=1 Tax=Pedobacter polaris TaxID=2571273 RepID=A0A4U1CT71_9SPHI|nr:tetratricopeptide repeat-containing sensor histidine kinase [Pedobacter polaris]TKC10766.1 sensor histidine kinase [Pedobacter polaris]